MSLMTKIKVQKWIWANKYIYIYTYIMKILIFYSLKHYIHVFFLKILPMRISALKIDANRNI